MPFQVRLPQLLAALVGLACGARAVPTGTLATTPQQLVRAVNRGALHVVVQEHIDVRDELPTVDCDNSDNGQPGLFLDAVLCVRNTTKSIRGDCMHEAAFEPMPADISLREPGQCLLLATSYYLFDIIHATELWIHNLYLRIERAGSGNEAARAGLIYVGGTAQSGPQVWMTSTVMQGDGQGNVRALWMFGAASSVFMNGSAIETFTHDHGPAVYVHEGRLSLKKSKISDCVDSGGQGAVHLDRPAAVARLESVSFISVRPRPLSRTSADGAVYSNTPDQQMYLDEDGKDVEPQALADAPTGLFLSETDSALLTIQQEAESEDVLAQQASSTTLVPTSSTSVSFSAPAAKAVGIGTAYALTGFACVAGVVALAAYLGRREPEDPRAGKTEDVPPWLEGQA